MVIIYDITKMIAIQWVGTYPYGVDGSIVGTVAVMFCIIFKPQTSPYETLFE